MEFVLPFFFAMILLGTFLLVFRIQTNRYPWQWLRDKRRGVLAWHFLPVDGRLGNDDGREVKEGETLEFCKRFTGDKPELCATGMHASKDIFDAMPYALGPILTRVIVKGSLEFSSDKLVGESRKCLKLYRDLDMVFLRWAYQVTLDCTGDKDDQVLQLLGEALDKDTGKLRRRELLEVAREKIGPVVINQTYYLTELLRNTGSKDNAYCWRGLFANIHDICTDKHKTLLRKMLKEAGVQDL
ncbi:MAG: hypothetical protein WC824_13210 [Bacteroidota bacterium]|jgi:hypothetical protein